MPRSVSRNHTSERPLAPALASSLQRQRSENGSHIYFIPTWKYILASPQPLVTLVLAAEDSALDAEPEERKAGQLATVKRALDEASEEDRKDVEERFQIVLDALAESADNTPVSV